MSVAASAAPAPAAPARRARVPLALAMAGATASFLAYAWDLLRGEPVIRIGAAGALVAAAGASACAASLLLLARRGGAGGGAREGLVIAVASCTVFLAAVEATLRTAGYGHREAMYGRMLELVRRPYEEGVAAGRPYRLNRDGFRDDDIGPPRPGELRVICLGDSSTFGFGVDASQSYPERLQAKLREGGRLAEVINAGMVSATSWQGARLYEEIAGRFGEEWVIAAFGHNDRWLRPVADARGGTGVAVALLSQSRSVLLLSGLLARLRPSGEARLVPRVSPDEHAASLEAIARRAAATGARAILLSLPDNPEAATAGERARELAAQGRSEEAYAYLREQTRMSALNPYPEVYDALAAIAEQIGKPEVATRARHEAAVRRRLARRSRDEAAYRAAVTTAGERSGALTLILTEEDARGRFLDVCHPDPAFHEEIARRLALAMKAGSAAGTPDVETPGRSH